VQPWVWLSDDWACSPSHRSWTLSSPKIRWTRRIRSHFSTWWLSSDAFNDPFPFAFSLDQSVLLYWCRSHRPLNLSSHLLVPVRIGRAASVPTSLCQLFWSESARLWRSRCGQTHTPCSSWAHTASTQLS
jgi:hypothetical protein